MEAAIRNALTDSGVSTNRVDAKRTEEGWRVALELAGKVGDLIVDIGLPQPKEGAPCLQECHQNP